MDKDRKILVSILAFLAFAVILSLINISITMNNQKKESISFSMSETAPGVGIVKIVGPITMSGDGSAFGSIYSSDAIIRHIGKLQNDPKVKAIVVRIDSPGGTVAATQEIFKKLYNARKKNIPLVASMGDVAASGGYYTASACNYIFANHGTITGSIGVIMMSPNLKGLFEKLGIQMNVIKSGKYKDILSSSRDVSEEELQLLQSLIDSTYKQFLKDVSLGRNLPISDFEQYADGRVVSGSQALDYKLVDQIGTYEDAIMKAKELANLPADAPVYYDSLTGFDQFLSLFENKLSFRLSGIGESIINQNYSIIEYRYIP